jgi:hypothetical protein
MAIATTALKNSLASAYASATPYGALYTTAPGATAGTEVSGGSYARQALSWSTASNGSITATATFSVPAGVTVVGAGVHSAVTAGNYLDGGTVTSQTFATAGTYTNTYSYTQS